MQRDGFSVEAAVIKGRKLPSWLEDEPQLLPGDDFYLRAFWELSTCRSSGFGIGPIPWRDIVAYADYAGMDSELVDGFVMIIRRIDAAFMKWSEQEQERNRDRTKRQGK